MCTATEQVLFSCPIARTEKIVSLCIHPGDGGVTLGRYHFGTTRHVSLVYPSGKDRVGQFHSTIVPFAGDTRIFAFSFTNGPYEYVVYQTWDRGGNDAGVLAEASSGSRGAVNLKCRSDSVERAVDLDLLAKVHSWGRESIPHLKELFYKARSTAQ